LDNSEREESLPEYNGNQPLSNRLQPLSGFARGVQGDAFHAFAIAAHHGTICIYHLKEDTGQHLLQ
jgi:hypothetical protein